MIERPLRPRDLIELLDLEERELLADELGQPRPNNLGDDTFAEAISHFSATTLLGVILGLRMPSVVMLQEIFEFLTSHKVRGRATTRAVLLESAENSLRVVFDTSLQRAITVALNMRRASAAINSLGAQVHAFELELQRYLPSITPVNQHVPTRESRQRRADPVTRRMAWRSGDIRRTGHPGDIESLDELRGSLIRVADEFDRLTCNPGSGSPIPAYDALLRILREGAEAVARKHHDLGDSNERARRQISADDSRWQALLEHLRVIEEAINAVANFQTSVQEVFNFLHLRLWRDRWRVYELWMLVHILRLFERCGFALNISQRISGEVWDLRFTRDRFPIAMLVGQDMSGQEISLEVYYQLYRTRSGGADMPDIAIKWKDTYLLVLDPKRGTSYGESDLRDVARRYADQFSAQLTVIHNYYRMPYDHVVVPSKHRCLLVSDIKPDSAAVKQLDRDILAALPADWPRPTSTLVALVDVSGSAGSVRARIVDALRDELSRASPTSGPESLLMSFNDTIVDELPLSVVHEVARVLGEPSGGTNLDEALGAALQKLAAAPPPRSLLVLTDGEAQLDTERAVQQIRELAVSLRVLEATDTEGATPLRELAQMCGGEYCRV